jgi:hypothetical protein
MTFFNIILNITIHIHPKKLKSQITHPIFMKMALLAKSRFSDYICTSA